MDSLRTRAIHERIIGLKLQLIALKTGDIWSTRDTVASLIEILSIQEEILREIKQIEPIDY